MTRDDWHRQPLVAALAFFTVCLALIALRPLLPIDETRYLTVAWEMWQGGSKIVPHLNGEVYSHKPPLLFWLINLVWAVTGPSELAARLVGPLAGVAAILMTGRLARHLWPQEPSRAGQASWVLATGGVFLAYGSATMFDTLLTVATLGAMLSIWTLARQPGWQPTLGLGLALAVGVLAKGPVILIHVLPVALSFALWRPAAGASTRQMLVRLGLALLIALALIGLWLGPALILGGEIYRNDILWRQSAGRMVSSFAHGRPIWFFVALAPLFLWPWGWGREVAALWRGPKGGAERFLLIWAGGALMTFSLISGKQIHYLVPELAAVALLLSRQPDALPGRWPRFIPMMPALFILGFGSAAALGLVPPSLLNGGSVGSLELALAAVAVGTAIAIIATTRSRATARLVVAPATLLAFLLIVFQTVWATNNPARLAPLLASYDTVGIATTETGYAGQFSFAARLVRPVKVLREDGALATWLAANPGGLVIGTSPIPGAGLQLLREIPLHGDTWFAYRVENGQ